MLKEDDSSPKRVRSRKIWMEGIRCRERERDLGEEEEEMREKRNVAVVEGNHESKSQCSNDGRREKTEKRKSISERHWQLFFLMRYEKNGSCCLR